MSRQRYCATLSFLGRALLAGAIVYVFTAALLVESEIAERPAPPESPSGILERLPRDDCWTGQPPADMVGEVPGHVIWQRPDGTTVYSKALVGPALDTLFGDGNLPGRAIAFCR